MFYLCVSLQTSSHTLKDASDSAPSLCQKMSSQIPSVLCHSFIGAAGLYMAVSVTVGPDTDSDRLFVCVFILARLSGLSDKTVK